LLGEAIESRELKGLEASGGIEEAMDEEIRALYEALVAPSSLYCAARVRYEKLREELIEKYGYDAFREKQKEAFAMIRLRS
jgi:hypothetical protein